MVLPPPLLVAHRLNLTARGVLQVSPFLLHMTIASSLPLCQPVCGSFSQCEAGSLDIATSQVLLSKTALLDATSLPSTLALLPHTLCRASLPPCPAAHAAQPSRVRHTMRSRQHQLLAEFYYLTLNWLLADSIPSIPRHVPRALQILPPGCLSSRRRLPFQPRPGGIGRECLQVLRKGWTALFLPSEFAIPIGCQREIFTRTTGSRPTAKSAPQNTDMLITGKL